MEKDRLLRKGDKNGLFLVKASFVILEGGNLRIVPLNFLWNSCVPKSEFLCLGSLVGKSSNHGAT